MLKIKLKESQIFIPLLNQWKPLTDKEKIRQEYLCYLVNQYGFSLEQIAQEKKLNPKNHLQGPAIADIVVWKSKEEQDNNAPPIIIFECKADNITVRAEDYFKGYNYAFSTNASFLVAANKLERRIFRIPKDNTFPEIEEVLSIPSKAIINQEKEIEKLLQQTKSFTRKDFAKLLLSCHNIIRNNDKLSPEAAFDEISKILFIKIIHEKISREKSIFCKQELAKEREHYKKKSPNADHNFCQFLFEATKKKFKDLELFPASEVINVRENSFEAIIERLAQYNLGAALDDVKGIAFEKFLGRTFRGELGQFFTPRTIVDFMVEVLDPEEGELICDPCCGSGGFLIKAFQYVKNKIEKQVCIEKEQARSTYYDTRYHQLPQKEREKIDQEVENIYQKLNNELNTNKKNSRLSRLSLSCIFGVDANPRMSRTAKMNMIMHGAEGYKGVYHHDGLLNIDGIFENRFDVIFTNPPFGTRVDKLMKINENDIYQDHKQIAKYRQRYGTIYDKALAQVKNNIGKPLLSLFQTGTMTSLTEALFIERCLNLLKPGGRMGIVLPEGILNNQKLEKVRDFIESKAKILFIVSLPKDVFVASGAKIKSSLLFLKKFTTEENQAYQKTVKKATSVIQKKFKSTLQKIQSQLQHISQENTNTSNKKEIQKKLEKIQHEIAAAIKKEIKTRFDYPIPTAIINKAGISTTGQPIENELKPLAKEFQDYRTKKSVW